MAKRGSDGERIAVPVGSSVELLPGDTVTPVRGVVAEPGCVLVNVPFDPGYELPPHEHNSRNLDVVLTPDELLTLRRVRNALRVGLVNNRDGRVADSNPDAIRHILGAVGRAGAQ